MFSAFLLPVANLAMSMRCNSGQCNGSLLAREMDLWKKLFLKKQTCEKIQSILFFLLWGRVSFRMLLAIKHKSKTPISISCGWLKSAAWVFHCFITNSPKFSSFKEHTFIICFYGSRLQVCVSWVFCSRCHKFVVKVLLRMHFHLGAQLGKNPVASSFMMLAEFISLPLFDWGSQFFFRLLDRGHPWVL